MARSMASAFVHRQPYLFWAARASGGTPQLRGGTWSGSQPDALESPYFRHPALGKTVSSHTRHNAVLLGGCQDLPGPLEFTHRPKHCSPGPAAGKLRNDV